jgi:hypothetical protein
MEASSSLCLSLVAVSPTPYMGIGHAFATIALSLLRAEAWMAGLGSAMTGDDRTHICSKASVNKPAA